MNFLFARLALGLITAIPAATLLAAPVDLTPPRNSTGYADENGYFRMVQRFGEIRFSDGFELPLRFEFWTGRDASRIESPYGWHGWICGPIESTAETMADGRFLRVNLLCAKTFFLERSPTQEGFYRSPDGAWSATIKDDLISVSRADGWRLRFKGGEVLDLRTDREMMIHWIRDEEGLLERIDEEGQEEPVLTVDWTEGEDGVRSVNRLTLGSRQIDVKIEKSGPALLFYDSVFSWKNPRDQDRSVTFIHQGDRLDVREQVGLIRRFNWARESGHLLSDGLNRYEISPAEEEGGSPMVSLHSSTGETVSRQVDAATGTTLLIDKDERTWKIYRATEAGALHSLIQKVEYLPEEDEPVLVMENHFDALGRIVARDWRGESIEEISLAQTPPYLKPDWNTYYHDQPVDLEGDMVKVEYRYDASGRHVETLVNDAPALKLEFDNEGRPTLKERVGRYAVRMSYDEVGGFARFLEIPGITDQVFGYVDSVDPAITMNLPVRHVVDEQMRVQEIELLDGRVRYFEYDDEDRLRRDWTVARDGETRLEEVEYGVLAGGRKALVKTENLLTGTVQFEERDVDSLRNRHAGKRLNPFEAQSLETIHER